MPQLLEAFRFRLDRMNRIGGGRSFLIPKIRETHFLATVSSGLAYIVTSWATSSTHFPTPDENALV